MNTLIQTSPNEVSQLPVAGLRKLASSLQIKNYGKHTKNELTELVNQAIAAQKTDEAVEPVAPVETVEETAEEIVESAEAVEEAETTSTEEVVEVPKAKASRKSARIEVTADMKTIIADEEIGKSEKFRKLNALGMSASQIAEETSSHYSFVHGVIDRSKNLIA